MIEETYMRVVSDREPDNHSNMEECWCNPDYKKIDGELFVFHRNSKGETAVNLFAN